MQAPESEARRWALCAGKPRLEYAMIALVVFVGAALRISQMDQSLYADELWSWVGATDPSFGGMLDWVRGDQEVTPPLFTSLAWASALLADPSILLRLPSLVAGIATIALVFEIARRALGMRVALISAVLAALSPTLAFYAVEGRAYGLVIALVAGSTLTMLLALERGRSWPWWAAYGALSAAAMYTHYTAFFPLLAQFGWVLALRAEARGPASLANLAAAAVFLLWLPGLSEDFASPAAENVGLLAPFGFDNLITFTGTFAFGHPAATLGRPAIGLHEFYGTWAEVALFAGLAVAAAGAVTARVRRRTHGGEDDFGDGRTGLDLLVLLVLMAFAAPVGCALISIVGDDLYLPRNLTTSLPTLLIACGALIAAAPAAFRAMALVLTIGALGYGALSMLDADWQRPDVRSAANLVEEMAEPNDAILDAVWFGGQISEDFTPPPLALTLDAHIEGSHSPIDALSAGDLDRALSDAAGDRLWVVGPPLLVAAAVDSLGLSDDPPVVSCAFVGLSEIEVVAFEIPAGS